MMNDSKLTGDRTPNFSVDFAALSFAYSPIEDTFAIRAFSLHGMGTYSFLNEFFRILSRRGLPTKEILCVTIAPFRWWK